MNLQPTNNEQCRVPRGGGWIGDAWLCRSAQRFRWVPASRDDALGFRLIATTTNQPTRRKTMSSIQQQIAELEAKLAVLRQEAILPKMIKIPDRSYSVAETPCTWGQWEAYCLDIGISLPDFPGPKPTNWRDYPVVNVSWNDAQDYIKWLNAKTGHSYRLPTEDEYEHFCGDHTEGNPEIAVYNQDSIQPVRTKKPNKFGLYDVLGCVWEWGDSYYG